MESLGFCSLPPPLGPIAGAEHYTCSLHIVLPPLVALCTGEEARCTRSFHSAFLRLVQLDVAMPSYEFVQGIRTRVLANFVLVVHKESLSVSPLQNVVPLIRSWLVAVVVESNVLGPVLRQFVDESQSISGNSFQVVQMQLLVVGSEGLAALEDTCC